MNDASSFFTSMQMNIKKAELHFKSGNFLVFDYYLSWLSKDIRAVRKLYGRKPAKSAESSKGENHKLCNYEQRSP